MPVYAWKGIDAQSIVHTGMCAARTPELLQAHLLEKGIGLVDAEQMRGTHISSSAKQQFFTHLASLVQAHIQLYPALIIIASTVKKPYFKAVIEDIALHIAQGVSFSEALSYHNLSDQLTNGVIIMSEKTGSLGPALQALADHRAFMQVFQSKVRSALIGPAITVLFFILMMLGIFLFVVPQFEHYFLSHDHAVPPVTGVVMAISRFFRSGYALILVALSVMVFAGGAIALRTVRGRLFCDAMLVKLPWLSSWYKHIYHIRILKMMGMLLDQGVPLASALDICIHTTRPLFICAALEKIKGEVLAGSSLSVAWRASVLSNHEIEAFLTMGESAGDLGPMCVAAGDSLLARLYEALQFFTAIVQPLLLLFLGIFVALLLIAVYMPLLSLADIIV